MRHILRHLNELDAPRPSLIATPTAPDAPGLPPGPAVPPAAGWLVAGVAGVLLIGLGLAALLAPKAPPALPSPTPPACAALTSAVAQTRDLLAQGKAALAAALAESELARPPQSPCLESQVALARLAYQAATDTLWQPATGSELTAPSALLRWRAIEEQADRHGVPLTDRLSPTQIARQAYTSGNWPLADLALRQHWQSGAGTVETVSSRYAVLRNWGRGLLTESATSSARERGRLLLGTAQAIARQHHLPNGEACADLLAAGLPDCREAPVDTTDPMLDQLAPASGR